MLAKSPIIADDDVCELVADHYEQTDLEMTKSYQRFRLYSPNNNGFIVGLADFACFGWKMYDLAGYPYDNEHAALFSDWVRLGQDVETAKEALEETAPK